MWAGDFIRWVVTLHFSHACQGDNDSPKGRVHHPVPWVKTMVSRDFCWATMGAVHENLRCFKSLRCVGSWFKHNTKRKSVAAKQTCSQLFFVSEARTVDFPKETWRCFHPLSSNWISQQGWLLEQFVYTSSKIICWLEMVSRTSGPSWCHEDCIFLLLFIPPKIPLSSSVLSSEVSSIIWKYQVCNRLTHVEAACGYTAHP